MYEARSGGTVYTAKKFSKLTPGERESLRDGLECTSCGNPAYFIRKARNGRAACFGARPHAEDCEFASLPAATVVGNLPTADPVGADDDVFLLQPANARGRQHIVHDDNAAPHRGRARRHTGDGPERGQARTGLPLNRLLRRLIREPAFADSTATLVLGDNTRTTIREWCYETTSARALEVSGDSRIFWGTIRYVRIVNSGAWLNLGPFGAPGIKVSTDFLDAIMRRKRIKDPEELQGAAFIYAGRLIVATTGLYLFPDDLEWFTVRLARQDLDKT